MGIEQLGFEVCRGLISRDAIHQIRADMLEIMRPFCDENVAGPEDLDKAFAQVTKQGGNLRGNILKICSRLASLPLLLAYPALQDKLRFLGIKVPVIQAYSVLCMEPYEQRFLFEPHQDLKQRMSFKSLAFWIPLNGGESIGGLGFFPGSHKRGPLKHELSERGHLSLPQEICKDFQVSQLTSYQEGDCLILSPFLIHWSMANTGSRLRWTVSLKVDDASEAKHLPDSIHPFPINEYVDTRSNEERIAAAMTPADPHKRKS